MEIPQEIIARIQSAKTPLIIGVSGFGGAGKSSFAKTLGAAIAAPVVGVDSFQKDGAFDTNFSLWEIMDFARLEKEVLQPFAAGEQVIRYGHFNTPTASIAETREIENTSRLVVEGVGLFRPELAHYFGLKIWVDCPMDAAIARGKRRDREEYGNPTDELWDTIWKKNDEEYLEQYKPKDAADFVFTNS
jgi:uridine kinase